MDMTLEQYNDLSEQEQLRFALSEALEVIDRSVAVLQADGTWQTPPAEPLRGFGEAGPDSGFE